MMTPHAPGRVPANAAPRTATPAWGERLRPPRQQLVQVPLGVSLLDSLDLAAAAAVREPVEAIHLPAFSFQRTVGRVTCRLT